MEFLVEMSFSFCDLESGICYPPSQRHAHIQQGQLTIGQQALTDWLQVFHLVNNLGFCWKCNLVFVIWSPEFFIALARDMLIYNRDGSL